MKARTAEAPTVKVYPFHQRYPGMPDLFHVSCDQHPYFGFCGEYPEALRAEREHLAEHTARERS